MQPSIHEIFSIRIEFPHPAPSQLGYAGLLPLLQYLESSGFPKPIQVQFSGKSKSRMRKKAIQSYIDPLLLALLNPEGTTGTYIEIFDSKKFIDDSLAPRLYINQGKYRHTLTLMVHLDTIERLGIPELRLLFQQFIDFFPAAYIVRGGFVFYQGVFYNNRILSQNDYVFRGHFLPYLIWLQYLSPQELIFQGGKEAFQTNPLLKTTPLHQGLVVEVGDSPYDIFTEEGEDLLVQATLSLPPVQYPSKSL